MKTFLKIIAGILAVIIVIVVGLNLYFTDERLKATVMPYVNEAVGRPVQVESMSLTFFSTFPQPGLSIEKMSIPGESERDTLMALDELVASVELFPLLSNKINISEIYLRNPKFTYVVYADSSTNLDFLMHEETAPDTSAGYEINIPYFQISEGQFGYRDMTSATDVQFNGLQADISLNYAQKIQSTVDLDLEGLSATVDSSRYVQNLPLSLSQESTIDMDKETVTLEEGTFSIRGLALNLSGSVSNWGRAPAVDLKFNSSSDNFGELLRLVPDRYREYTEQLETRGSLSINGNINGIVAEEELPAFNLAVEVQNGYLKNPDLPEPVQNIQLSAKASNKLLTVEQLTARAGENNLSGSGKLTEPMEENGTFSLDIKADVNLSTVREFYDISQFDIENMGGSLNIDATASGSRSAPEQATFDAIAQLSNGTLKFSGVPQSIENITLNATGTQSSVAISEMQFQAADNTFSMQGSINEPLDETKRTVDLSTSLDFNLATIKDFYPIDEDTLRMRGKLAAEAVLKGKATHIERAVQKGSIRLSNGFIDHKSLGRPIKNLTLESRLDGPVLTISKARFETGENNLSAAGTISNYLSDNRTVNLNIDGEAALAQIQEYYDLKPTVTKLNGDADLNLRVSGPLSNPAEMKFNGQLTMKGVNMRGEGLVQPVTKLSGRLELTPATASLQSLKLQLGSSDIAINGSLDNYMAYLKAEKNRKITPRLKGSYKSNFLNLDELIDWEDTTSSTPTPIHLPDLNSSVSAEISKMVVTGVTMNQLKARASTTPQQIQLEKASVQMFGGKASGSFTWEVPQPDHTMIAFKGSLEGLQAESFFREYQVLGEKSKFHQHVSGAFNVNVDYYTELNKYLDPLIKTSRMDGSFGMTKSRLKGHPLQEKIADLLKTDEFRSVALDKWNSNFSLDNSILAIKNLRLTSGDIGVEMNGTQHLIKETIDYQMQLLLPGRFKNAIASVITTQAAEALTQENGTIMVPLRISGTLEDPRVGPDKEVITPIVRDYLKNKAGNVLKKLFGN